VIACLQLPSSWDCRHAPPLLGYHEVLIMVGNLVCSDSLPPPSLLDVRGQLISLLLNQLTNFPAWTTSSVCKYLFSPSLTRYFPAVRSPDTLMHKLPHMVKICSNVLFLQMTDSNFQWPSLCISNDNRDYFCQNSYFQITRDSTETLRSFIYLSMCHRYGIKNEWEKSKTI
jgi:hypothetical protein